LGLKPLKYGKKGEEYIVTNIIIYSPFNISRVIKSKRMRWAGLVGRMGEMININNFTRKNCM
jgi:hypothetical protein